MQDVIEHFRLKELVDQGENGRAWSTCDRYVSYLDRWIGPRWGKEELTAIKAPIVEEWLKNLKFDTTWRQKNAVRLARKAKEKEKDMRLLAPASKARIRDLMSVLFNHAIRWEFTDRNPISGPNKGAGVRQSAKRQNIPDILEVPEIQAIIAELELRERVLLFLDMATGLRRGELAGVKWQDFDLQVWTSTSSDLLWTKSWAGARQRHAETDTTGRVHGTGFAGLVSSNAVSRS